jgi:hypothetical protein
MQIHAALLSASVLLIAQSARAEWTYDAVDALLASGPIGDVSEPLLPPSSVEGDGVNSIGQASTGLAAPEAVPYSRETPFFATMDQPDTSVAVASTDAPHNKSKPLSRADFVPEPSALAMGTVALIFFLLFGRRRRPG